MLAIGMIIAYMFDVTNVREGSLIVVWLTLLLIMLALLILVAITLANNYYLIFLLGMMNVVVGLTGFWATLQFRWLQRESPNLCLFFEKMLVCCTP